MKIIAKPHRPHNPIWYHMRMVIHQSDNVEIREDGHKYALRPIACGENVVKYGMPIGHATRAAARSWSAPAA